MPVCLRDGDVKVEEKDHVLAMREPAGRLGEIVRTLKRNHQAQMPAKRRRDEDAD